MRQDPSAKVTVLVTSAGRRNYLLGWFRDAALRMSLQLHLVAADADARAPALVAADSRIVVPPFSSEEYGPFILQVCHAQRVDLLFSLNDYDIAVLSRTVVPHAADRGLIAALPPIETAGMSHDKLQMAHVLARGGYAVPDTVSGSEFLRHRPHSPAVGRTRWVVKHRYGSGSSGILVVGDDMVDHAIAVSAATAPRHAAGTSEHPADAVVVQPFVAGDEYGLDLVCTFSGEFQAMLARRKLSMRAGETDRAMTVESEPFEELGRALAGAFSFRGTSDIDIIVDSNGTPTILDINPRFGGGYPFSHLAGADIPACYLAWTAGLPVDPEWLRATPGVASAKFEALTVV
jgi:carbamoyl-phosphate synthase large subunit